ncbi:hypothetical protein GQ53DRAFT_793693 [Thozetella sp. PMI_491]|nr:hypothetical protein GQ53DRAFT_793693 [Thozetella sp. PMI_491]
MATTPRWKQDTAVNHRRRGWPSIQMLALGLLIVEAFKTPTTQATEPAEAATEPGPQRDLAVLLHPEEHLSRDPGLRQFTWNITKESRAPDGVKKEVFLINNQFPGPTIEARSGDVLEIEILNFSDEEISLHWHGMHMRGANHMDGPVGITQCAIKPGKTFTYRVPIDDQAGTFWYHAHSEVHRGDGLYGGLVVHNPAVSENDSFQYDRELLFLAGDWYHWQAEKVLATFAAATDTGNEPNPDSLLINGLGYFECSMATAAAPVDCSEVEKPELLLDKSVRYRIRLVNVGSLTGISFTIADSVMKPVQVDGGQPLDSHLANTVGVLYPAQRVDFIVSWPKEVYDTDTEVTIVMDDDRRGMEPKPEVVRFDLPSANGTTLASPLPDNYKPFMIYTNVEILNHLFNVPKGFINRTTWEPQSLPLVASDRKNWDSHQLVPWTGSESTWVELTINNIDSTGHPFHLHGFDFYVVASYGGNGGWDYYNPFQSKPPRGGPFNLVNPVRRDTVYVPPWGYVVLRFLADNDGIWALHCHVLWHQASGMTMAIQVLGDEIRGFSNSPSGIAASRFCST